MDAIIKIKIDFQFLSIRDGQSECREGAPSPGDWPKRPESRLTFSYVLVSLPGEPDIAVRKAFFRGCFVFVIISLLAGGGLVYFLKATPTSEGGDRLSTFLEALRKIELKSTFSPEREWTDVSGRKITGVLVSGTNETALVRVLPSQRLFRIPLTRLSAPDQEYVRSRALDDDDFDAEYPPVANQWPQRAEGRTRPLNLKKKPDGRGWTTTHYDFTTDGDLPPELAESLAVTCEAVDVAISSSPLPLLWGRDHDKKRPVFIYSSSANFKASGAQDNWGAYYAPHSNAVHVPLAVLTGKRDPSLPSQFSLRKRDDYRILVHELTHQASVSYLVMGLPAWVGEGTAELFRAFQTSPGQFTFFNQRALIRNYLNEQIGLENQVQFESLPLPKLDKFLSLSLYQFNRQTAKSPQGGFCEYAAAMLLTEYFCFADGNSMRAYLEAVFTGLSHADSAELHLMRGRSPNQIEALIAGRWQDMGLKLVFVENPNLERAKFKGGIGIDFTPRPR